MGAENFVCALSLTPACETGEGTGQAGVGIKPPEAIRNFNYCNGIACQPAPRRSPGQSHLAGQNSASSVRRYLSSHAARLSLPRKDPFEFSVWITFNAMWRNTARLFGPFSNRVRC